MLTFYDDEKYVLIRTLPDGTVNAVQPVAGLSAGTRLLQELREAGERRWYLFDTQEKIVVSARAVPPAWPTFHTIGPACSARQEASR